MKPDIRPDTGYKKKRIFGATLVKANEYLNFSRGSNYSIQDIQMKKEATNETSFLGCSKLRRLSGVEQRNFDGTGFAIYPKVET